MANPLISIIIPMYNVERYISRCLESCINQTLNNIEILIIDDCGSDSSLKIAQSYAKKDCRIRIVNNTTNQGTFNARLQGIKKASGIYLLFLDADDFLAKEACEVALKKALSSVDSHEVNSPLRSHSTYLANFKHSLESSLASRPKFSKEAKAFTASRRLDKRSEVPNTRIFSNANGGESVGDSAKDSSDSADSNSHCEHSQNVKQSNQINPHEVRTLKGVGGERLDFAIRKNPCIQAPSPLAEKATSDSKNLAESRRSERVESFVKSTKSSEDNLVDCHEFNKLNSRNDDIGAFPQQNIDSRNDDSPLPSLRGSEATEAIHLNSFRNSDFKNFIDSHSHNRLCDNDSIIDSHDSATQNLAMTARGDSINFSDFPQNSQKIYQNDFEIPASMIDSLPDIVHFRSHYLADSNSSFLENLKHKVRYILPTHLSRKALKGEAIAYHFFLKSYHFPRFTIWDKCYKKSLLLKAHSVLPPISRLTMAEDMLKFFAIAIFAKSYVSVDKRLYFYCLNATSSTQDRGKILARITQMHAIIKVLKHIKITQDSNLQSLITQRMIKNLKSLIILELRFTPLQELQSQFLQEDAAIYHWLNALLGGGQELYAQLFENLLYLAYILEAKSHLYPHICLYFKLWAYQALKDSFFIHFRRKHYA